MIKVKSHKRTPVPTILGIGDHIAKIESVEPCFNTENVDVPWTDRTPQIAIKYVSGGKSITQWVSLRGYVTSRDTNPDNYFGVHPISGIEYLMKDGRRVEDKEKTKIGLLILAHIAYCSGIENDSEIEISDLVGRELLIRVAIMDHSQSQGQLKVVKTFKRK